MTNALFSHAARRSLIVAILAVPTQTGAQVVSSVDLFSRSARGLGSPWSNQLALSPSARLDLTRLSFDGRWTALRTDAGHLTGDGALTATYFSPVRAGVQLSVAGFTDRTLINNALAVSRLGTDARLSYRRGMSGAWVGREISADNKATVVSPVPRMSGGAWQQYRNAVFTLSVSSYSTREGRRNAIATPAPTSPGPRPGPTLPDTGQRSPLQPQPLDTGRTQADSGSNGRLRAWNDAEVAVQWGVGRLAFRGVIGTRFFAENQPNELWAQAQGTYAFSPDLALVTSTGVHPSAAAYGVSRARFLEVGFRVSPGALVRPRLPRGVRPVAAAFEIGDAVAGRRTLRIRVPNARTVELSGDFTGWKPISLSRTGEDQWEAKLPIAPGIHRLVIRVDGDAWTPPPGVNAAPDEFQGTVGVIVVRD